MTRSGPHHGDSPQVQSPLCEFLREGSVYSPANRFNMRRKSRTFAGDKRGSTRSHIPVRGAAVLREASKRSVHHWWIREQKGMVKALEDRLGIKITLPSRSAYVCVIGGASWTESVGRSALTINCAVPQRRRVKNPARNPSAIPTPSAVPTDCHGLCLMYRRPSSM